MQNYVEREKRNYRCRRINEEFKGTLSRFPNFSKTGSITGMKRLYYGIDALLVKDGQFIYNVSSDPNVYFEQSH